MIPAGIMGETLVNRKERKMSVYSNRVKLGSRHPNKPKTDDRSNKAKWLLPEDEKVKGKTPMQYKAPVASTEKDLEQYWARFTVVKPKYDYPKEDEVPAGWYFAEIKEMNLRMKDDCLVLDVGYYIENYKGAYQIVQSYYEGSMRYKKLCAAVVAAGIDTSSDIRAAIGMREKINLAYVSEKSDVGSIVDRTPWEDPTDDDVEQDETVPQVDQDDDSEFDDFLSDED